MKKSLKQRIGLLIKFAILFLCAGILIAALFVKIKNTNTIESDEKIYYAEEDVVLSEDYYNSLSAIELFVIYIKRNITGDYPEEYKYSYTIDENLIVIENIESGYCGITDGKGNWVVEPDYSNINDFYYEDYGLIKLEGLMLDEKLIDKEGNFILGSDARYLIRSISPDDHTIEYEYFRKDDHGIGGCDMSGNVLYEIPEDE